jgi:hypothetical protein
MIDFQLYPHHHPPGPPQRVHLRLVYKHKRRKIVPDLTVSWTKPLIGTATSYNVIWIYDNTFLPPISVPSTAAGDAGGYTLDFNTSEPTITLSPGDAVNVQVIAVDATDNAVSTTVSAGPVIIPLVIGPPQNVTLVLS